MTKKQEYEAAKARYGGQLPQHIEAQYQEELQNIGRQQASNYAQLTEVGKVGSCRKRLALPASFSYIANKFTLRDAVGAGVMNPHFGASKEQLPFFLSQDAMMGAGA